MAMPVNMILVVYDILCILSYDFNKLTMLYIHVHISSSMTNKSGLTFFLSIKYLSVCLSVHLLLFIWLNLLSVVADVVDVVITTSLSWLCAYKNQDVCSSSNRKECHLIHLTTQSGLSWPSLVYYHRLMCKQIAKDTFVLLQIKKVLK